MLWGRLLLATCAVASLGVATATAQEDVFKNREALMKGFGQRMGVVKAAVVDGTGTLEAAAAAAQEIAAGAPDIAAVFPEGSINAESEALPVIWEKWPEFEAKSGEMQKLAAALADAAKSGDKNATLAAFGTLGKNGCGGCHESFRQKKS